MKKFWQFLRMDLWILVLDLIAVNLSYLLALAIRFYMNGRFLDIGSTYFKSWLQIAPYYTVIALIIFLGCRMYGGIWRYVGLNDVNRIIGATLLTTIVMVAGTLLFVRRMPITFYLVGAVLQFVFTVLIRFAYRLLLAEKKKAGSGNKVPALVIGSDELGRKAVRHLEEGETYQPVTIIGPNAGRTMDGIPVVSFDELRKRMDKVQAVFIADRDLDPEQRQEISKAAEGKELFDYTGALANMTGAVPLTGLLETISGPVTVKIGGQAKQYGSGRDAINDLHTRYLVTDITGEKLTVELEEDDGTAYLRQHMAETGEEVSFF